MKTAVRKKNYKCTPAESDSESITSGSEYNPSESESESEVSNYSLDVTSKRKHWRKPVHATNNSEESLCPELKHTKSKTKEKSYQTIHYSKRKKIESGTETDSEKSSSEVSCRKKCVRKKTTNPSKCVPSKKKFKANLSELSDSDFIDGDKNAKSSDSDFINRDTNYESKMKKIRNLGNLRDSAQSMSDSSDDEIFKVLKEPSDSAIEKSNLPVEKHEEHIKQNSSETLLTTEKDRKSDGTEKRKLESSVDSAFDSFNLSINLESVGPVLQNHQDEIVPCSGDGTKKYPCLYCLLKRIKTNDNSIKVHYCKLVDHYQSAHEDEKLIQKLSEIPKVPLVKGKKKDPKQIKRENILNYLLNQAAHYNNILAKTASEYVVSRRTQKGRVKTIAEIGNCIKCKKHMSKASLRKHVSKCTGLSFKKKRIVQSSSRAAIGNYHPLASDNAIIIISKMRENPVLETIRHDSTIFLYLNAVASQFKTAPKHHKKVRSNLSRLGNLKLLMMKNNSSIKEFSDILDKKKWDDLIDAVTEMGKPDLETNFLQTPATSADMYHLLKDVAEVYEAKLDIKDQEKTKIVTAFLNALKSQWHKSIGNTIAESQAAISRNKNTGVPSSEDTALLRTFLEKEMSEAYNLLKKGYTDEHYERLRNALVSYLHLTNCRRAAEIELLSTIEFEKKILHGTHYRVEVRGKRTKPVPIVFDELINQYLEFLIKNRRKAKIRKKNNILFSKIDDINNDFSPVSACVLMTDFSYKCGAKKPELLRGTFFRKQAATEGMKRGLNDEGVEKLCGYLGHTSKVHHKSYRQSIIERDIRTAQMVKEYQTGAVSTTKNLPSNKSISMDTHNNNEDCDPDRELMKSQDDNNSVAHHEHQDNNLSLEIDSAISNEDTINYDAVTKNSYTAWKKTQIETLLAHFPDALNTGTKVPSAESIRQFISTTTDNILKNRTEPQIRSWIHSQRKNNEGKPLDLERNHVPVWIYSKFRQFIQAAKLPSQRRCAKILGNSPSKANITIVNILNWVTRAIEFQKKK